MERDEERITRVRDGLREAGLDAVVVARPANVLLLSGYWPVVGTAVAVATREGQVQVIAPEDEEDLARRGFADGVTTFSGGSLDTLTSAARAVREPLGRVLRSLGLEHGRVGHEAEAMFEPATYAGMQRWGPAFAEMLAGVLPDATRNGADELLARWRTVKTPGEVERIRIACEIAEAAFTEGAAQLEAGIAETDAAERFGEPLSVFGVGYRDVARADGYTFAMSGPNAAKAYAAYQRSRARLLADGDLVLIHCNSYADGFWTDVTRTFVLGDPDERQSALFATVFEAREAAFAAIAPGAKAADVDRAARDCLTARGYGKEFVHPTGHGVGYAAIDHTALPRLHPKSPDTLEVGMVFNVEPGLYFKGWGGLRHCDMVVLTEDGAELLTPWQVSIEELIRR